MARRTPEERAFLAGHRLGRLGWPASKSPYAAGDRAPVAVAWRKGWTAGDAIHRQVIATDEATHNGGPTDG